MAPASSVSKPCHSPSHAEARSHPREPPRVPLGHCFWDSLIIPCSPWGDHGSDLLCRDQFTTGVRLLAVHPTPGGRDQHLPTCRALGWTVLCVERQRWASVRDRALAAQPAGAALLPPVHLLKSHGVPEVEDGNVPGVATMGKDGHEASDAPGGSSKNRCGLSSFPFLSLLKKDSLLQYTWTTVRPVSVPPISRASSEGHSQISQNKMP